MFDNQLNFISKPSVDIFNDILNLPRNQNLFIQWLTCYIVVTFNNNLIESCFYGRLYRDLAKLTRPEYAWKFLIFTTIFSTQIRNKSNPKNLQINKSNPTKLEPAHSTRMLYPYFFYFSLTYPTKIDNGYSLQQIV